MYLPTLTTTLLLLNRSPTTTNGNAATTFCHVCVTRVVVYDHCVPNIVAYVTDVSHSLIIIVRSSTIVLGFETECGSSCTLSALLSTVVSPCTSPSIRYIWKERTSCLFWHWRSLSCLLC
uniref:Uncharacterized protein n=1 Tax=Cacopsylla melanoneura TaxID=428564 RepID=A0A8D9B6G2_9HEMI